jgi:hypothetical protein
MNYRGSHRKLRGNAKAAMMAAIEIYNKPVFQYRDECIVILLLNAWELAMKALLSQNKQSIFYPKKRKQPYRTLSWQDALTKARPYFPIGLPYSPIERNLELLGTYRDNAVHFYNAKDFGVVLYALAQTSIKNFRDFLEAAFSLKLEAEINWQLLPLGIRPPIDIVSYISGKSGAKMTGAVRQFLSELASEVSELKDAGEDTGRLLTIFNVKLESVKKIGNADVVMGVQKPEGEEGRGTVFRPQDPNITHPLRQTNVVGRKNIVGREDVVGKVETLHGKRFTPYMFQAIVWKYDLKNNPQYCWQAKEGVLTKYSNDIVTFVKRITAADLNAILTDYRQYLRSKTRARNKEADSR